MEISGLSTGITQEKGVQDCDSSRYWSCGLWWYWHKFFFIEQQLMSSCSKVQEITCTWFLVFAYSSKSFWLCLTKLLARRFRTRDRINNRRSVSFVFLWPSFKTVSNTLDLIPRKIYQEIWNLLIVLIAHLISSDTCLWEKRSLHLSPIMHCCCLCFLRNCRHLIVYVNVAANW